MKKSLVSQGRFYNTWLENYIKSDSEIKIEENEGKSYRIIVS